MHVTQRVGISPLGIDPTHASPALQCRINFPDGLSDIIGSIARDLDHVRTALGTLRTLAGGSFAALDATRRAEVAAKLRTEGGLPVRVLTRIILLCYYRDDRVMVSLGLEARPPFPKGHAVEQGDWSLLDPVRARQPFWRPVS